ncbi:MAG TPA: hypothetical protein VFE16_08550 [Candidatus Cybelea sp.]|nr:hypothetical protein [Candidatus Cybelea sp.]
MLQRHSRGAFVVAAAVLLAAGCSSNSLQTPMGTRVLAGPTVAGPRILASTPQKPNAPTGWPDRHKKKAYLFVADGNSGVLIYDPKTANGSPIGSVTSGVNGPAGVAVDKRGALYVANGGASTVTVYPKGQNTPRLTITAGISEPYGIAVDSKGNIFVSNLGNNTVTAYAKGATTPYATIDFSRYGQPVGVGVDGKDNFWVVSGTVYEIPAGTTTLQDAELTGLNGPIGISFGQKDVMYVSNFSGSNIQVYAYGTTTPSKTITDGIETSGPTLGGFTKSNAYFQTNQANDVVGYKKHQTSPFSTLTSASPLGVASSPLVTK